MHTHSHLSLLKRNAPVVCCVAVAILGHYKLNAQSAGEAPLLTSASLQARASATNSLSLMAQDTNALLRSIAALQTQLARPVPQKAAAVLTTSNLATGLEGPATMAAPQVRALVPMATPRTDFGGLAGGGLAPLLINNRILNINFANSTKTGPAAIGQSGNDCWNPYIMPDYTLGTLQNLLWSDQTASPVDPDGSQRARPVEQRALH